MPIETSNTGESLLFHDPDVQEAYDQCISLEPDDPYAGSETAGLHDVLRAHFLVVDYFQMEGEGVAVAGPKSMDLLHSALSRQFVGYGGAFKWKDPFDRAATLFFGLVKNHAFHDANKRTALLTCLYQLYRCNRSSAVAKKEWEDLAVHVASGSLERYPVFRKFRKLEDAEVLFIAKFFRSKTRKIDKKSYLITYRHLDTLLRRHGFYLDQPNGNYINIVFDEIKETGGIFRRRQREVITRRVSQIGFPGWNKEVSPGTVSKVRRDCGLEADDGIDSQSFFRGVEPMHSLIAEYSDALRRLADR